MPSTRAGTRPGQHCPRRDAEAGSCAVHFQCGETEAREAPWDGRCQSSNLELTAGPSTCCCGSDLPASPVLGAYAFGPQDRNGIRVESSFKSLRLELGHPAAHLGCQEGDREALPRKGCSWILRQISRLPPHDFSSVFRTFLRRWGLAPIRSSL